MLIHENEWLPSLQKIPDDTERRAPQAQKKNELQEAGQTLRQSQRDSPGSPSPEGEWYKRTIALANVKGHKNTKFSSSDNELVSLVETSSCWGSCFFIASKKLSYKVLFHVGRMCGSRPS